MNAIYKYLSSEFGPQVLTDFRLKLTGPNALNDPFELFPNTVKEGPCRRAERYLSDDENLRRDYAALSLARANGLPDFETFRQHVRSGAFNSELDDAAPSGNASSTDRVNLLSRELSLLCLTTNHSSSLMWAHYADDHKGIALEFDRDWEGFHSGIPLQKVTYKKDRMVWNVNWEPTDPWYDEKLDDLVLTKSTDWKYEDEWRKLVHVSDVEVANGRNFLRIAPEAIKGVYFGVRCSTETTDTVRKAIERPELKNVRLYLGRLHSSEFRIVFEEVTNT